jgi:hypothetical protein
VKRGLVAASDAVEPGGKLLTPCVGIHGNAPVQFWLGTLAS